MKKFLAALLAVLTVFSLVACGAGGKDDNGPAQQDGSVEVSYPLTVTDMAGREVTLNAEPQKIVSGYYISSSACIALGLTDRIVAVEDKSDKRPIY